MIPRHAAGPSRRRTPTPYRRSRHPGQGVEIDADSRGANVTILHAIRTGTTDAPGARVRLAMMVILGAVVATGCRPYRRAALAAASSALVLSGVAIATGAPSCGMPDPDDPFGGAPCEAARATTIGYGATSCIRCSI